MRDGVSVKLVRTNLLKDIEVMKLFINYGGKIMHTKFEKYISMSLTKLVKVKVNMVIYRWNKGILSISTVNDLLTGTLPC